MQTFLGLLPFMISFFIPVELLWEFLSLILNRDLNEFKTLIYKLVRYPKMIPIVLGVTLTIILFIALRYSNKDKTLNKGNSYSKESITYFWLGSVLGYKQITLIRVPIYMQFKLLFKDLFEYTVSDKHQEDTDTPKTIPYNCEVESNEINLILSDTYQILLEHLPSDKQNRPTVLIERTNEFNGVRTYNQKFADIVREQTNKYSLHYERINIFATTNTQHNKEIVLQSFKNGGRTGFKEIYVYEQNLDRNFETPHLIK